MLKDFNFIPQSLILERKYQRIERIVIKASLAVLGIMLIINAIFFGMLQWNNINKSRLANQYEEKQQQNIEGYYNDLQTYEKNLMPKREVNQQIMEKEKLILNTIGLLEEVTPGGITVIDLSFSKQNDSNSVKLDCVTKDVTALADFLNKIRLSNKFQDTFTNQIGQAVKVSNTGGTGVTEDAGRSFSIELVIKEASQQKATDKGGETND